MTDKTRIAPRILVLALSMTACEYIGPQLHEKMPLPQAAPIRDEQFAVPESDDGSSKTAKVEIFPNTESTFNAGRSGSSAPKGSGKGEYSLNFDDADLGEVAKVILSDILGKNYTLSPQVTGKVTLQTTQPLTKDDLIPTLEMLLSVNNAALVVESGMYLIKPSNEAMYSSSFKTLGSSNLPSGYQTRVIPVHNVAASEIADILKPLLPEKSQLYADPNRNILLVSGSAGELSRILDVVRTFDIDVLRGRSFALFTPAHVDAGKIIEELQQIFNRTSGEGRTDENSFFRFIEIERMNAVLAITHNAKYLQDIESWVFRLDRTNPEASGGVNVYRAQHVSAVDLANTLSNIFGTGTGRGSRSASIASGRRSMSASNSSSGGSSNNSSSSSSSSSSSGTSAAGATGSSGSDRTLSDRKQGGSSGSNSITSNSFGTGGVNNNSEMAKVRIIPDEGNNALIIVANSEEYAKIQRILKELDVLPLQVLIDATIVEVTLNNDLKYGIQWYFSHNNGGINHINGGSAQGIDLISLTNEAAKTFSTGGFSYAFSSGSKDIQAVLNASATKNNINVISSPSLMVLNNQEATIKVGDSVPIRSSVTSNTSNTTTTGIVQTSSIQMVDTGVNLSVRPRVNAGGLVIMDILQSVNQAVTTTTSQTIDSPTIQKREIESSVAVQSGETIVLGGLIKENNDYKRDGVPLLHEIPIIGPLFGGTTRNKDKSELVVLITPRVVNSRQDASLITDEFRRKLSSIYEIPAPVIEVDTAVQ
ncbi:type II secretion system secretin GspD [Methylomonas methanica]|uniref:General secretion pathway protein D n=1 Tax=Methylomonas methanica (strain DSM 25384 / MC09) TaxID=857087 RepID=G0A037_METMM|nr:type II secretion system secretin GspD [Methylomonas methanica]AEG01176.1 general secretion pathway protein D [Methylomonas methanica MC09]